ncbi:MAG: hypothetical protein QY332_05760 [Anaerolineales bacterium]|nr:MAG: hypothetical protein QY332_05760 [Anaerolineales bacterium]
MNKCSKTTIKLVALAQILALILAACSAAGVSATVCHATGDAAKPYEEIVMESVELANEHRLHANDIFPVPVGGCPASLVEVVNGTITICHATNSETNPYEEITVSINGLNGHGTHEGDIIPMPAEGCPAAPIVTDTDEIAVCHATGDAADPYEVVMVPSAELDEYLLANPTDINPMPVSGCPAYLIEVEDGKVTFCHANDASGSYEEITVSVNGLDGHGDHEDDVFPISEEEGCPASVVTASEGKVTICHATGSAKNPYVQITVSVNGLNGHDRHNGDIIPAPAGGCPTTRP